MTARHATVLCAVAAIALTIAQDVAPGLDAFHGWPYITALAVTIAVMAGYTWNARRGADGIVGRRLALGIVGALAVALAGFLSALIGPDTVTVVGTPGTVAPVPDLRAAAFFAPVDGATLAHNDGTLTLRRPQAPERVVGPRPVLLGLSVVYTQQRPAAYVVARDAHGDRLTITQPNNPSFLSPVMLFRQQQAIHDKTFPFDTFATPAAHRIVRILYFGAADLAAFRHGVPGGAGAVLSVADDGGNAQGVTIAASGVPVRIGGLALTITLGTYPVLVIASAPEPLALFGGILVFLGGALWAAIPGVRRSPNPSNPYPMRT